MPRRKSITKRRRGLFLEKLKQTGNVSVAAVAGEIARQSWYDLAKRDEAFAGEWDDAVMYYLDGLASVATKRGVVGETEARPYTFYGKEGKETRFRDVVTKSDACLLATLKARHPDYQPRQALEHTSPDGSMTPERRPADYSNLTNDELRQLAALQRKAHGGAAA